MCGRYGFIKPNQGYERFNLVQPFPPMKPRYNVAPSQEMPVIVKKDMGNVAEIMRWGLIPSWVKDPKIANMMINARAETLDKKPSYAKPFRTNRCLVPATGFFEWMDTPPGRLPYYIHLKDDEIFAFAGLYDINDKIESKPVKTYTIITTEPNGIIAQIHNRMPVIFNRATEKIWLDPTIIDTQKLLGLLQSYPSNLLDVYPVSKSVGNPANDYPEIINPEK